MSILMIASLLQRAFRLLMDCPTRAISKRKRSSPVVPDNIEEPRLETQRVEVLEEKREDRVFVTDFSQIELQHAMNLERLSLSTQAHAAYNRAIDVAALKGDEALLQALLARAGFTCVIET